MKSSSPPVPLQPAIQKMEDVTMTLTESSTHADPPLPLARAEQEHVSAGYVLEAVPSVGPPPPTFMFKQEPSPASLSLEPERKPALPPAKPALYHLPVYTMPPLNTLPVEYHKKGKPKQSRKRDKEKGDGKNEWTPMGAAKWGAIIRANPVYKKVARAHKCLSSRDWDVSQACDIRASRLTQCSRWPLLS